MKKGVLLYKKLTFFFFFIYLFQPLSEAYAWVPKRRDPPPDTPKELCNHIFITDDKDIDLNPNEKILVCGDEDRHAWQNIPHNQARFHLRTFLQARGYHHPQFTQNGKELYLEVGEKTYIQEITLVGDKEKVDLSKRKIRGKEVLSPKNLSLLESWIFQYLQARGYPCPEVKSFSDQNKGIVNVLVESGPIRHLGDIEREEVEDLKKGVLQRYDAFEQDELFNKDFLNLTARRLEEDGIVQSAYFTEKCEVEDNQLPSEKIGVIEHVIPGPPRLVTAGVGANTEGLLLAKASWKSSRFGELGSSIEASAFGSFLEQEINLLANWYFLSDPSRWYLKPSIELRREDEKQTEYISGYFRPAAAVNLDTHHFGFEIYFGPQLKYTRTFRGAIPGLVRFVSLVYDMQWMSHYFEFYRRSPRRGFYLNTHLELNHDNLLSEITVQKLEIRGEYLWNFKHFNPPLIVFGLRGGLSTTFVSQDVATLNQLPPEFRYFLGGSRSLRGFAREELPNSSQGGLSTAFLSFETRFNQILPHNLQPFVFLDAGMISSGRYFLEMPIYWSPGVGIRWESPIGALRGTFSHGFIQGGNVPNRDKLSHPQFYLSFGEEF